MNRPVGPRLRPGIGFTLKVSCPPDQMPEIRRAVQACILFGGYGSRTRRPLGSLTLTADAAEWLPPSTSADKLKALVGGQGSTSDTPSLAGASLLVGEPQTNAEKAWKLANDTRDQLATWIAENIDALRTTLNAADGPVAFVKRILEQHGDALRSATGDTRKQRLNAVYSFLKNDVKASDNKRKAIRKEFDDRLGN